MTRPLPHRAQRGCAFASTAALRSRASVVQRESSDRLHSGMLNEADSGTERARFPVHEELTCVPISLHHAKSGGLFRDAHRLSENSRRGSLLRVAFKEAERYARQSARSCQRLINSAGTEKVAAPKTFVTTRQNATAAKTTNTPAAAKRQHCCRSRSQ